MADESAPPGSGRSGTSPDNPSSSPSMDELLSNGSERDLLVRRYLLGYLSEDDAEAFEARFVHDRGLLEELEEAERFIAGFRELARDGRLGRLRRRARGGFAWALSGPWSVAAASALGLIVAVAISIAMYGQVRSLRREVTQLRAPQVNTQVVDLVITRSAATSEPARLVHLPVAPGWIVLAMDTGSAANVEHRVRLLDAAERVVAESTGLRPDELGIVYWSIDSSMLRAGDYQAQLSVAADSSEPEVHYVFRVMAPS
jgi:hypothetical protein